MLNLSLHSLAKGLREGLILKIVRLTHKRAGNVIIIWNREREASKTIHFDLYKVIFIRIILSTKIRITNRRSPNKKFEPISKESK